MLADRPGDPAADRRHAATVDEIVDPAHAALVLIDLQNDHISPGGAKSNAGFDLSVMPSVVSTARRLVAEAHVAAIPVIFIQDSRLTGDRHIGAPFLRSLEAKRGIPTEMAIVGTWGWQLHPDLTPDRDDIVLHKYRESAFVGTALDLILRSMGVRTVVLAGVVTQGCVEHTARDALLYDYYGVVVGDGCGAHDRGLHDSALERMARTLDVVTADRVIGAWSGDAGARTGQGDA